MADVHATTSSRSSWPCAAASRPDSRRRLPPSVTSSAWCAPSSSGSSNGTTTTPPEGSPSTPGTSPNGTSPCLGSGRPHRGQVHGHPGQDRPAPAAHGRTAGPDRIRAGELGGLRDDAVFRMSGAHWLRIPVGKLHNDRNVPLHPVLIDLIVITGPAGQPVDAGRPQRRPALRPPDHPPLRAGGMRQDWRSIPTSCATRLPPS